MQLFANTCCRSTSSHKVDAILQVKQLARLSLQDPQYVSVHENAEAPTPAKLEQARHLCLHRRLNLSAASCIVLLEAKSTNSGFVGLLSACGSLGLTVQGDVGLLNLRHPGQKSIFCKGIML